MTAAVTPRPPAAPRAFTLPIVHEMPPVTRPGTFAATW
jgi:hypothetical protein